MKLVRHSRLFYQQGKSDKVYEADLCDVSTTLSPDQFVVNFRYGRRGTSLREGTKTPTPVDRDKAEKLFDSLVVSKLNKGYLDQSGGNAPKQSEPRPQPQSRPTSSRLEGAMERVRNGLADIATGQLDERTACRMIWRAGELGAPQFVGPMLKLMTGKNELKDYCLLWALGRCGDEAIFDSVSPWIQKGSSDLVKRMALWASMRLATDQQRPTILEPLKGRLPHSIASAIDSEEQLPVRAALDDYFANDDVSCNIVLPELYLLSHDREHLRKALLHLLSVVPLKPNYFRGVRQVYKAAEFFKDAAVFGLLNRRFDSSGPFFGSPRYGDKVVVKSPRWEYINSVKELKKPSSRLAYSNKTREYLRQRSWRSLRRMGELGLDDYVEMAMGVLLAYRDQHKQEPRRSTIYFWDSGASRSYERVINYDEYASFVCFNHILQHKGEKYLAKGRQHAWQLNDEYSPGDDRGEAFPELWDRHPDALLMLMQESELEPVHDFASRALVLQTAYCDSIPVAALLKLLQQAFQSTVEFAFHIARERYDLSQPDFELVIALLDSVHEPAVSLAIEWVNEDPANFAGSVDFVLNVMTARTSEIRHWGRVLVELAAQKIAQPLVQAALARLLKQDIESLDNNMVADVQWALLEPLKGASSMVEFEQILALLAHAAPALQALAGRLVINHERPAAEVPATVFARLLESPVAEVRGVGVALFAELPDAVIVRQPELVESFCLADEPEVRAGVRGAIARLAGTHKDFATSLCRKLVDRLFRAERSEGLHADLVSLLTNELAEQTAMVDKDLNWRLLQARSHAAQSLGAWLLPNRGVDEFSVRQWAQLGRHADVGARQWAWQHYCDHSERIVLDANDALRIVDSDWDDSREFAFDYFREQFPADAWTPNLMIGICDSVRGDVQTFGRELITRFFDEQDGPEYLLKLSQHPSANVQLFASNYLEGYASGDLGRLQKLQPYFITVLSQVNRNRITKDRVMNFLLKEAALSSQVAYLVARIFGRQSVTVAIIDKAGYLKAMRDLSLQYPEIEMPLTMIRRPVFPSAAEAPRP